MTDGQSIDQDELTVIEFGDECDLHHFHARDTEVVVMEFLRQGREKGLNRLRLVHGKGKSTVKRTALAILAAHPDVAECLQDGPNWGATIVVLREP